MNIAARAGRWSAAHWKTATFGWLALVICAVAVGNMLGTVKLSNSEQSIGESARAEHRLVPVPQKPVAERPGDLARSEDSDLHDGSFAPFVARRAPIFSTVAQFRVVPDSPRSRRRLFPSLPSRSPLAHQA